MIEDYISLFGHVYWSAVFFHSISLVLGFSVIAIHQNRFQSSRVTKLLKSPVEAIYILTVFSTIANMLITLALFKYLQEGHLGFLPSKQEFIFAFYHALEGLCMIGWHLFSFLVLKHYEGPKPKADGGR